MYMTVIDRVSPPSPARPASSRSPFVRLRELDAGLGEELDIEELISELNGENGGRELL